MPFACIFVPDFPVEALLRTEPELRSQALAVLEGKAPLQKVFAVNQNARRAGVSPGMTKIQVEACPAIALRARAPLQEASAHAALLDCAQSFSPRVEDAGPDTIVLDLDGMESLFGSTPKIAQAIARQASDLGLEAHIAVASNPDTAMLTARGFADVTLVPQGKEAEQLGGLPIEVLFAQLPAETASFLETFSRWGVRNLRQLAALPEIELSERMGQHGVYWQKLARGVTSRTLVPFDPPLIFEEAIELEYPVLLLEPVAFLLSRLLDQLCSRLAARALATQELKLTLDLENGARGEEIFWKDVGAGVPRAVRQQFHRTLRLPVPLLDPKTFLKLLQLDLKAHPPGAPIVKIHLHAEPVRPRTAQSGLFLPPAPEPERLELTIARIAGIVGEDNVGSVEMLDTHRPEGFCMQRFGHAHGKTRSENADSKRVVATQARVRTAGNDNETADLVTALRLFRPQVAVSVSLSDGKPARISSKRKEVDGEILWAAGPWRSSGDWWENEGWARDEWDIAVPGEGGIALYRLVRDLLSGKWAVEGSYD